MILDDYKEYSDKIHSWIASRYTRQAEQGLRKMHKIFVQDCVVWPEEDTKHKAMIILELDALIDITSTL